MRYLVLLILMLVTATASAQSSSCYGGNCPNSLGTSMQPAKPRQVTIDVVMTREKPAAKPRVKR